MSKHAKKMIAPIVITLCTVAYLVVYFSMCLLLPGFPLAGRVLMGVVLAALIGVSVYVLVERIKEIRSGEEDDLSQY